jgi:hypothetical protein
MTKNYVVLIAVLSVLAGCNRSSGPKTPGGPVAQVPAAQASMQQEAAPPKALESELQKYSGTDAKNCGVLAVSATEAQSKAAADCALQSNQGKQAFFVAYAMPGMMVGVAGDTHGKLYTAQAQGGGSSWSQTSGNCPAQLRVASSGRVTCFAPGDMGSMSPSHAAGAMTPGTPNPHGSGTATPHSATNPK